MRRLLMDHEALALHAMRPVRSRPMMPIDRDHRGPGAIVAALLAASRAVRGAQVHEIPICVDVAQASRGDAPQDGHPPTILPSTMFWPPTPTVWSGSRSRCCPDPRADA